MKPSQGACCHDDSAEHPDHSAMLSRLRRVQGQVAGIERMITERRYCPEILIQFKAVSSAIRAIEANVFKRHIESCVASAVLSKDRKQARAKIDELVALIGKE